jgi:hypothetical protein
MDDCFDDYDGPDWEDWMIIGPLSEDIAGKSEISNGPGGNGMTMRTMNIGNGLIEIMIMQEHNHSERKV